MTLPVGTAVAGILVAWAPSQLEIMQALTIILVMFVVSLSAFIWAAFFRKPRRHHHHHHRRSPRPSDGAPENRTAEKLPPVSRRKRFRREHRPRNPTLAEAGGLPPERADEPGPPSAPTA
jgi:hypothetical protein